MVILMNHFNYFLLFEMQYAILFLALTLGVNVILLITGMIKPGVVVWWEDIQNRRRVLRIYGRVAIFLGIVLLLLVWISK